MLFLFPGLSHMFWFLIANASSDVLLRVTMKLGSYSNFFLID
jgi:hypothetical protein